MGAEIFSLLAFAGVCEARADARGPSRPAGTATEEDAQSRCINVHGHSGTSACNTPVVLQEITPTQTRKHGGLNNWRAMAPGRPQHRNSRDDSQAGPTGPVVAAVLPATGCGGSGGGTLPMPGDSGWAALAGGNRPPVASP